MKSRNGQVALYLVGVLVAISLMVVMNVGVFLSVRTKNRVMNAGDASALAVAGAQGRLLNEIGRCNLEHLRAALEGDGKACDDVMERQARLCLLGPLTGFDDTLGHVAGFVEIGNETARENGIPALTGKNEAEVRQLFAEHVIDIRTGYAMNPDQYPEAWPGAWAEYATALEVALSGELHAVPDSIDFVDAQGGHLLLNYQFYNSIAGRNWCWFHFNAPGVLDSYGGFRTWGPLPSADEETRQKRCVNSEIYSLHLEARVGSAVDLFGVKRLCELLECDEDEVRQSAMMTNQLQVWYCYDRELWREWWEFKPDGPWRFPSVGSVRPEYDIRGCAACCRVMQEIPDVLGADDKRDRVSRWTAAAKPFGTVTDEDGAVGSVTSLDRLVLPSFSDVRLVPWDTVGGRDDSRPNLDMALHVRKHLPRYLSSGVTALEPHCFYCTQLREWESDVLRATARNWLQYNSRSCVRSTGGSIYTGGTPHGH